MIRKGFYVGFVALPVALVGYYTLQQRLPVGPVVLAISVFPLLGIILAHRSLVGAVPDMVFGAIDTGLLTVPAIWGGMTYGVAGAIAGVVIGDALTDAIAGFFEGSIAEWLRGHGVEASREAITTSLGKMSGCLIGSGSVLTIALLFGVRPGFG
ncbi:MAG: hypothetical protein ABIJ00_03945 [Candidatus Eisenbacteria bacterium]